MMDLQKMLKELPVIQSNDLVRIDGKLQWVPVEVKPHAWIVDGQLHVSGENGDGLLSYNSDYIAKELEDWAAENGCYWEWESPGAICLAN
jgi:hypothetical protein